MLRSWLARSPVLFVTVFATILHLGIFLIWIPRSYVEQSGTDFSHYATIADNLLAGRGFSLLSVPPYTPDTIRTPLYPYFLAAIKGFTGSFYPSIFLTLLFGVTIPAAGMQIAKALNLSLKTQIGLGLLLAIEPHLFYYSMIFGTEGIVVPLSAWSVVCCLWVIRTPTRWGAVLAGVSLGLLTLGRPIFQFVVFLLMACLFWRAWTERVARRAILLTAGMCFAAFALVVSPWLIRNVVLFHTFDYSNVGWFNVYTRVAATTEAIHVRSDFYPMWRIYLERLHEKGYVDHTPVLETDVFGYEFRPIFIRESLPVIRAYPKEFILSQVSAGWTVISQDSTIAMLNGLGILHLQRPTFSPLVKLSQEGLGATLQASASFLASPWVYAVFARLIWIAIFACALFSVFLLRVRGSDRLIMVFLTFYMLIHVVFSLNTAAQADARYRVPFIFVEIPLAVAVVIARFPKGKRKATPVLPTV